MSADYFKTVCAACAKSFNRRDSAAHRCPPSERDPIDGALVAFLAALAVIALIVVNIR